MDPREELEALRRMAELEAKASGQTYSPTPIPQAEMAGQIPGQRSISQKEAPVSWRDRIMGVVETPAAVLGGIASGIAGNVGGVIGELSSPAKQGSPEARAAGEALAAKARAQFYQPRTQTSQEILAAAAPVMEALGAVPSVNALQLSQAAGPAAMALRNKMAPVVRAPLPFGETPEAQAAAVQAKNVAESTRNAPKIEAAQAAPKYGIALPPDESNPTKGNLAKGVVAGEKVKAQMSKQNAPAVNAAVAQDMGLPENTPLTKPAFTEARNLASGPYRAVEQLPVLEAPSEVLSKIAKLKGDESLIGGATTNAEIAKLVDDAQAHIAAGMAGDEILKNIRQMRAKAQRTYKAAGATPDQMDVADVRMGIANALEDLIDSNIKDPKLLSDFRKARVAMAKTYAYQSATDLNTGNVDPRILAKITAESDHVTGTLADLGKIAGNYPSVLQGANVAYSALPTLTRSGLGGSFGYALGSTVGMPLQGSIAGAATGGLLSRYMAKKMATPEYQAAHAIPIDYRPPVNNLRPADINYGPNQLVPYDFSQATTEAPNFVLRPNEYPPKATFVGPETTPQIGLGGTMETLANERARAAQMSRTLGAQAEQRGETVYYRTKSGQMTTTPPNEPADMYTRVFRGTGGPEGKDIFELQPKGPYTPPKRGAGVAYVLDEQGNLVPETTAPQSQQLRQPSSLETAVQKLSGNMVAETKGGVPQTASRQPQAFAMTSEERIAWNKAKADLSEVVSGLKTLDDKAIAAKMMDRAWVEDAISKAREKAAMFDDLSKRIAGEQAKRDAAIKRDQMFDLLDTLEQQLRAPRPTSRGGQGPKTRAAKRNALAPETPTIILNNLIP